MRENNQPGNDSDETEAINKHRLKRYALLEFLPIGLRVIFTWGGLVLIALILVSVFAPHMTERIKFFTTNFLSLVVLVAILVQAYINRRQWESMDKQSDAMQGQLDVMHETLAETRTIVQQNERSVRAAEVQAEASRTSAVAAETSARAAEQSAQVAMQGSRPYLQISAHIFDRPDEPKAVEITFSNQGNSPAEVNLTYDITITGGVSYEQMGTIEPFTVDPRNIELKSIAGITPSHIEAVFQDKARLRVRLAGKYGGIGGPYPVDFCRLWAKNRGLNHVDINQPCDVTDER